jgi:polysaccharide export outer membrane protein
MLRQLVPEMIMPYFKRFAVIVATAVAVALLGCASPYPQAPRDLSAADFEYIIGPLDNLNVIVWRNPELSMSVPVRPDGKLTTPLVDDMQAVGKTPTQLSRDLEKGARQVHSRPVVSVVVTNFVGSPTDQVRVIGEAAKPQVIAYRKNMSVLDVMIQVAASPISPTAMRPASFDRQKGASRTAYVLRDLVKRGDISANVDMRPATS